MAYLKPEGLWPSIRVQYYSKIRVLQDINNKLNDKQKKLFQKNCFGHFLDIKVMNSMPQLEHHLVVRICEHDNPDELCFNIQGNIVTFGIKEFAFVMGLKTSSEIELERNNFGEGSLRLRIFG